MIATVKMADTNDTEVKKENGRKRAPCSGLRSELKDCIMSSDCVVKVVLISGFSTVISFIITFYFQLFSFLCYSMVILPKNVYREV